MQVNISIILKTVDVDVDVEVGETPSYALLQLLRARQIILEIKISFSLCKVNRFRRWTLREPGSQI